MNFVPEKTQQEQPRAADEQKSGSKSARTCRIATWSNFKLPNAIWTNHLKSGNIDFVQGSLKMRIRFLIRTMLIASTLLYLLDETASAAASDPTKLPPPAARQVE